jgi:hypothetical protein
VSALPDPGSFLSGEHGEVGGRRGALRRAADAALDRWLAASGTLRAIDAAAATRVPPRSVLVASVYRPPGDRLSVALQALHSDRHEVRVKLGSTGTATLSGTVAHDLAAGKFENLNALIGDAAGGADWLLVVDDDVVLPPRFLDRMVALAELFDLALAQPAQSLASHAAWEVTRRRPRSLLRETRFVEIGPVTLFSRAAASELIPFPPLRLGWGLDLAWAATAAERGWRLGIADALAVRHEASPVGASYSTAAAVEEAQRFLATRPYLSSAAAREMLATHRRLPS